MKKLTLILDQTNWLEATWYEEDNKQIYCESFSGHPEHIAMLRAKAKEFGTELDEALISECIANFKYPTEEELAQQAKEQARQEALTTIAQLEASQLRSIRELMLDANNEYAKTKLEEIEAKIQAERAKI